MQDIRSILKQYWGFDQFRPLQEDIIRSILEGHDTLALMPTGGGKSLCYQVPAMASDGLCLVISPLIALMKDQVQSLRKKNITAYAIFSGMTRKEVHNILRIATESHCKFLYVSPERLESSLFKEYLPGMNVSLIAVDEAHCISQWGYDFRPPYLRIAALREELAGVPVLALTASATPEVQRDICNRLNLSTNQTASTKKEADAFTGWNVYRQSFERPKLSYSVFRVDSRINKILEILKNVPGTAIIYCKSRKRTKEIADLLRLHEISADHYHAGLTQDERNIKQDAWISNSTRVIVCTNAFGMGIDKPDVRVVIHADVPDCLENYYQEAGRGGRDGNNAFAVLLYGDKDLLELSETASLRFPSLKDIREVYQAVANYLQLHTGDGEGQYYEFDMSDFLKKFNFQSHTALYSLKALEQDGWLAFNEQVFLPAFVHFTTTKDYLYRFEQENPTQEVLIKTLLRTYEGIFDQPIAVSEKFIASLLRKDSSEIKSSLAELDHAGIITYQPQKDSPQLYFLRRRIKVEDLNINMEAFNLRKEQYMRRIGKMSQYVNESSECRSQMIGVYFGDASIKTCGICDNCLRKKNVVLSKEEFESLNHRILNMIKYESLHTSDLLQKLSGIKKEKAWKVIEFLQSENKLEVDQGGWVRLRN